MQYGGFFDGIPVQKLCGRFEGGYAYVEASPESGPFPGYLIKGCTGGPNLKIPDILPTQTANQGLIGNSAVPPGLVGKRVYIVDLTVRVLGMTPWSNTSPVGTPSIYLCDALGFPVGFAIPFNALQGNAIWRFPNNYSPAPLILGPNTVVTPYLSAPVTTFTYSASAGTVTAGAAIFPTSAASANGMVGCIVRVIDGTGKGLTALVASNTTTVLTLAAAFNGSLDATSVLAIDWQPVLTATSTTSQTLENAAGTPYIVNDLEGTYLTSLANGSHPGQTRLITANTTAGALTVSALTNNLTAGDLVCIGKDPFSQGAVDLGVGANFQVASPNTAGSASAQGGLFVAVNNAGGTAPLGSPVHIEYTAIINY